MPLRDLTNSSSAGHHQSFPTTSITAVPKTSNNNGPEIVIVSIEAAIGTGKSSLLRMLHKRVHDMKHLTPANSSSSSNNVHTPTTAAMMNSLPGSNWKWVFVQEPVEMWQDVRKFHSDPNYTGEPDPDVAAKDSSAPPSTMGGETNNTLPSEDEFNLLGKFYNDPKGFAFKLQSWAVLSRIETVCRTIDEIKQEFHEEGDHRPVLVVLERSWTSDRSTFAMMHRDSHLMTPMEWVIYEQQFSFAARNAPTIDGHIYLQCSAATCMHRLKKRDRSEESGVSADYQSALIKRHEDWLETVPTDKVCRINVDDEFISNTKRADMIFGELCGFANKFFSRKQAAIAAEKQQQLLMMNQQQQNNNNNLRSPTTAAERNNNNSGIENNNQTRIVTSPVV